MSMLIALIKQIAAPYLLRLIIIGLITSAIGGAFLFLKFHYENVGYDKAIAAIAAKDERAISRVKDAIKTVDDCYAAGKQWSSVVGLCN